MRVKAPLLAAHGAPHLPTNCQIPHCLNLLMNFECYQIFGAAFLVEDLGKEWFLFTFLFQLNLYSEINLQVNFYFFHILIYYQSRNVEMEARRGNELGNAKKIEFQCELWHMSLSWRDINRFFGRFHLYIILTAVT